MRGRKEKSNIKWKLLLLNEYKSSKLYYEVGDKKLKARFLTTKIVYHLLQVQLHPRSLRFESLHTKMIHWKKNICSWQRRN